MANCKRCNAPIKFIPMETGGIMPCDFTPHKITPNPLSKETFVMEATLSHGEPCGRIIRADLDSNGKFSGYTSHFATCPYANHFKKREVR